MNSLRLLGVGSVLAYRALFNWATPAMYAGTLLARPVMQLLFFAYLGRQLGVADDTFFLIGNAVLGGSVAGVFGGTMALANERRYGTLGMVLLAPRRRALLFLGRALPYVANGVVIAVFTLTVGALLLGVHIAVSTMPALLAVLLLGSLSSSFFGLMLGALGLRFRDVFTISNVAVTALILLSGANVPRDAFPAWMRFLGDLLPTTHAIEAGRLLSAGAPSAEFGELMLREGFALVGYAVLAGLLLKVFEIQGRRQGSLDTA
jgi:ABC-type multidrug transport system permease subunit